MDLPKGSTGLDAGCGIGTHSLWLAEETGPDGKIIGVDISSENLAYAMKASKENGLSDRVRFLQQDLQRLSIPLHSVDYVWCADTLWPVSGMNPLTVIKKCRRVVKPGGQIGILFWSTQVLLPGHPMLEARLNLAHARANPYLHRVSPSLHFLRALGWLRSARLVEIGVKSFVAEISAPLSRKKRKAIAYCLSMFWGNLKTRVSAMDWAQFQNLSDPKSSDCIFYHPDYCALIVYTLFHAKVPVEGGDKAMIRTSASKAKD
jgi:demethylmenaquinone methyltransferase/2-methoxy-6-polyprenyl-1,4-benzoquinol methylase